MSRPSSTSTSRLKRAATAAVALALGGLAGVFGLELALRVAPIHAGMAYRSVDQASPVMLGVPGRHWVHSVGWTLFNPRTGRLNNLGFNDPQTYTGTGPVTAVLGDSYVEGLAVPYAETLQARLRRRVGDCTRVYGFGVSGTAPSDYVSYLHWARQRLNVRDAVVVLSDGDLWEATAPRPGMHHFVRRADGTVTLERTDRAGTTPLRDAINASKLFRYVHGNLGFNPVARLSEAFAKPAPDQEPAPVAWVVDAFLERLQAELPPSRVTLVIDADRESIVEAREPEYGPERALLIAKARARGFTVVDLDPAFRAHQARAGRKVDFSPLDGHWNGLGHQIAADNVAAAWTLSGRGPACAGDASAAALTKVSNPGPPRL
ncbi:hypothetical protein [Caulobacter sp. 17J80-11]|uniref:hypothetical protein n=1 Tax=Caulobacter sp. 17J80-11 TaxID=2763502 RepID=UPI0016535F1B|nr:hypothetical protein [Caulobacter sp. 17J80-11]MBC6982114.1 hypothetical protein [Caulobacter sp. 17J80-11]